MEKREMELWSCGVVGRRSSGVVKLLPEYLNCEYVIDGMPDLFSTIYRKVSGISYPAK